MSNSSLQVAAATCPTMTTAEQAKAWQALVKAPDAGGQYQSARAMLLAVAHQIVGGATDKKPPPFGPAALSSAILADKRDRLAEYFDLPRMSE